MHVCASRVPPLLRADLNHPSLSRRPAKALVAWSLQCAFPGQAISLVAEESAEELRTAEGADMLQRITALVNEALAAEFPQVCAALRGRSMCWVALGCGAGTALPVSCCHSRPPTPRAAYRTCPPAQEAALSPAHVADLIDSGASEGGGVGRHWVLDPIDGTRGFVGMRQYAVCLGMLQEGEVRRDAGW